MFVVGLGRDSGRREDITPSDMLSGSIQCNIAVLKAEVARVYESSNECVSIYLCICEVECCRTDRVRHACGVFRDWVICMGVMGACGLQVFRPWHKTIIF